MFITLVQYFPLVLLCIVHVHAVFFNVHGHYTVVFKMGHLKRYGIDQNIRTSDNQNSMKIWLSPFSKSEGTIVVKETATHHLIRQ